MCPKNFLRKRNPIKDGKKNIKEHGKLILDNNIFSNNGFFLFIQQISLEINKACW